MKKILSTLMLGIFLISFTSALTNIYNCSDLQNMNNNLAEDYQLMNDIDCSDTINWNGGNGFSMIGFSEFPTTAFFTGSFNGNGFTISDLYLYNNSISEGCGMFGYEQNADFSNVKLQNFTINCSAQNVGGLVGSSASSGGSIINVSVVGGIVESSSSVVGGLVGHREGLVKDCYSTANVSGAGSVGGLIGSTFDTQINNSYTAGYLSGTGGGLIGNDINPATTEYNNCFYDNETTLQSDTGKGEAKSTAQMKSLSTFSAWDISNYTDYANEIWFIDDGNDYPRLFYEYEAPLDTTAPIITIDSPTNTSYIVDSIDLNWSANEIIDWAGYSLDGASNVTDIFEPLSEVYQETQTSYNSVPPAIEINYTIPENATGVSWRALMVSVNYTNSCGLLYFNDSYEVPDSCFSQNPDTLQLRINSDFNLKMECYNGTGYETLFSFSPALSSFSEGYSEGSIAQAFDGNWDLGQDKSIFWRFGSWKRYGITCSDNGFSTGRTLGLYEEAVTWKYGGVKNVILSSISDGSHTLELFANDTSGNLGTSSVDFLVDTTAPTITINSPKAVTYDFPSVDLDVSADEEIASWYYSFDNGVTNTTFTLPLTFDLDKGIYTLDIFAEDSVGNVGNSQVTFAYNTIIPNEIIYTGEDSSNIYGLSRSVSAGLGIFLQTMATALPPLLIIIALIGIITAIGFAISNLIKKSDLHKE